MKGKSQLQFSQVNNKIYDKTRIVVKKKYRQKKKGQRELNLYGQKGLPRRALGLGIVKCLIRPSCSVTEKSLRELVLRNSINIMHKHISLYS